MASIRKDALNFGKQKMTMTKAAIPVLYVLNLCLAFGLSSASAQGVVTTVAGTDWLFPGDGLPAVNAPLSASNGPDLALDTKGNLYLCDLGNAMVMRIGPDGLINVVAGNGLVSDSGDGGPAINASLYVPTAIAVDPSGAIYVVDSIGTIRKITPDGIIHTIAGRVGQTGFAGDEGPATNALLNVPYGIAVDSRGSIYIADTNNFRIRKITPDGFMHTIAGTGAAGLSGDGGPATAAQLLGPSRLTVDAQGNIYFVDLANTPEQIIGVLRKIDTRGIITTVAGGGSNSGDGIPATQSSLVALAVAVDAAGTLYIADRQTFSIRKVDASGTISTIAGSGVSGFGGDGGPGLKAKFAFNSYPSLAIDSKGNIYVGDEGNGRVRKIDSSGIVTTLAGNGLFHFSGNGGPATSATLYLPDGLAQDSGGNIYVSEPTYGRIRRIAKDQTISVYAGNGTTGYSGDGGPATSASLSQPQGLAIGPDGSLIFADTSNCVIRRIDTSGIITTIAGVGQCGFGGDGGPATQARLNAPGAVAVDGAGNIAFTEVDGNRIRIIVSGTIITLAGNGKPGYTGDGGDSQKAQVSAPSGIRLTGSYIYFSDKDNNVVRRIALDTTRKIETVAGNGHAGFSGDGGPATQASLNSPYGLTFDAGGNLYIADGNNDRIRRVATDGTISTFAGGGKYLADGVPATFAVVTPFDVLVSQAGDLLFTDIFFNRIRAVLGTVPTFEGTPASVTLTAPAGALATDQTIFLTGSIPGVLFTTSTDMPWLQASPASGAMPGTVRVSADASTLGPGSYQGNITINAIAKPFTQTIPVTFAVTAPGQPSLAVNSPSLQFSFVKGAAARTRPLSISNAGGGSLPFAISTTTNSGGTWLKASSPSGTLKAFGSAPLNITADPSGLNAGTYSGTVTLSSAGLGQKIVVPVTITVSAIQQTILIPQTGLSFFAVEGSVRGSVLPQFFGILNTGQGQMRWSVSASTLSGGDWLSTFPATGVTDAALPLVPQIRLDIDPRGLTAGIYYGSVRVDAPDADNTPQFVSVVLNVLSPGSSIGPIVQPTGLIFVGVAGGQAPGSQTVLVQNTSGNPLMFTSGGVTLNGAPLFDSLPGSGTITQSQPQRIVIQPKTAGLKAGVYRGALTLSLSDGNKRNIALVLAIVGAGGGSSSARNGSEAVKLAQSACEPQTLVPVFTQLADGFSIPASFPGQVSVRVIDDCANPMTAGGVNVGFSNGDPALRLISLKDGSWAGTWTPQHNSPQIVVTATAAIPEQSLRGQIAVKGGLQTAGPSPVISPGGVVNGASFDSQALAPGSLVTVFGSSLAQSSASSSTTPLPTTLANSSILIAGKPAPLLFASDGQVNAVVPYGIAMNTSQQVLATRSSSISVPQSVIIAPAAPGIFTTDGTQGIIVDQNNKIVGPGNSATAGDAVVIYCTGLGEVNPPATAGVPASLTQLSNTTTPVSVSIGGMDAKVLFSGLTPGFVGLYQVNAVVPSGVAAGDRVAVVLNAGGQLSKPAMIAIR